MDRLPDSQCDFCSAANPRWCFPAQNFYHKTEVKPVDKFIYAFMREEWAACDKCCELIHADNRRALAERVYVSEGIRTSLAARIFSNDIIYEVTKFQDTFRRNRLVGPPSLIKDKKEVA